MTWNALSYCLVQKLQGSKYLNFDTVSQVELEIATYSPGIFRFLSFTNLFLCLCAKTMHF